MPYSRDKAALALCRQTLSIPDNYLRRMRQPNGRITLDTPDPQQQRLQALLFDCFFSRGLEHPFDLNGGRSFPDLLAYLSWVAPQNDRLVLQATTAARVTSYLVPYVRTFTDGSCEVSGIPGLRLERITRKALVLRHMPTGGRLEIREQIGEVALRDMQALLEDEVRVSRQDENRQDRRQPAWTQEQLTQGEQAVAHHWAPDATTALRSALLARANLWWSVYKHRAHLVPARRSNAERCLHWKSGRSTAEIGRLLTEGPLKIPEARFTPPYIPGDVGLVHLGEGTLELNGPRAALATLKS
ncbi:hypothetical protein ACFYYB_26825 [Streptomyces sp. NPDC002886]|uniref:hypothetical protein n=1 Tax=Streptomyces sp. NPDC002886 TaxID=3364667 RepID=UPI0036B4F996